MNCKPGDLAVIVRNSKPERIGMIVRVIEASHHEARDWLIELPRRCLSNQGKLVTQALIHDQCLRPIRDNNGEDETLTFAGKPEGVKA